MKAAWLTGLHRLRQCKPLWTFAFLKSKVKSVAWDSISSFYALVFLRGVWEHMSNDTEGSTSRSLKVPERYDLSLWLTCAISRHTYSSSWLNPSLFLEHFPHRSAFAFSPFWSILQDKDLPFTWRSHLEPGRVEPGWIRISHDDVFHLKQHEVTVTVTGGKKTTVKSATNAFNETLQEQNGQVFDSDTAGQGLMFHLQMWLPAGSHTLCGTDGKTVVVKSCWKISVDIQEFWSFKGWWQVLCVHDLKCSRRW